MRWILPLLTLALVHPASAEIAVYTGSLAVQNPAGLDRSSIVRIAEVIDLATGKIVTVGLTGPRADFSFAVGPEVQYVVAKTTDANGRGVTAFAHASTETDAAGANFAISTTLRGRDATVTLSNAGPSQWPRALVGQGSLVAAAGTDLASAPASLSFSSLSLTLSEALSRQASANGGTLTQAAQAVGQQFRNRVASVLKIAPSAPGAASGLTITSTAGLAKTGAGTLIFNDATNVSNGALTISGGTLRLSGGLLSGGTTVIGNTTFTPYPINTIGSSGTSNSVLQIGGVNTTSLSASGATLNLGGAGSLEVTGLTATAGTTPILVSGNPYTGGTLTLNSGNSYTGSTSYTGGTTITNGVLQITGQSPFLTNTGALSLGGASLGLITTTLPGHLTLTNSGSTTFVPPNGSSVVQTTGSGNLVLANPNGSVVTTGMP